MNNRAWIFITLILSLACYFYYLHPALSPLLDKIFSSDKALENERFAPNDVQKQENVLNAIANQSTFYTENKGNEAKQADKPVETTTPNRWIADTRLCETSPLSNEAINNRNDSLRNHFSDLVKSDDIDDQWHVYTFGVGSRSETTIKRKLSFYRDYLNQNPNAPLALHQLLKQCNQLPKSTHCKEALEDKVVAADEDNGLLWLQLSALALKQGNLADHARLLEIAATKERFDEYFFQYIKDFEQFSFGRLQLPFRQRFLIASSLLASHPTGYSDVFSACQQSVELNNDSSEVCKQLAENMFLGGRAISLQSFGASLTSHFYEQTPGQENTQRVSTGALDDFDETALLVSDSRSQIGLIDEALVSNWLEDGINFGEIIAYQNLIDEVSILLEDPNYNPCTVPN